MWDWPGNTEQQSQKKIAGELTSQTLVSKYKSIPCTQLHCCELPYSGLFSWVEIFVKSWKRPSELNFMVFNFVA